MNPGIMQVLRPRLAAWLSLIPCYVMNMQVPAAALMAAVAIASEPGGGSRAAAEPENLPEDLDLHALMTTLMCR